LSKLHRIRPSGWLDQFPAALRHVSLVRLVASVGAGGVLYLTPIVFHQEAFSAQAVTQGLALAAQAFWGLGASLTPLPDPIPGAALVTVGPYGRCRPPLYHALLLCSLGVSLALGSLLHLALLLALCAVLGGKARREERSLESLHPDYVAYRASTPAIIPRLPWLDWRVL